MDLGHIMEFVQGLREQVGTRQSSAQTVTDPEEVQRLQYGVGATTQRNTAQQAEMDQLHAEGQQIINERGDAAWADFKARLSPAMPQANGLRQFINPTKVPNPGSPAGDVPPATLGGIRS